MIFSDTTNKDGIIQQIEFRTNLGDGYISGNSTLLAQITGQLNTAYMRATRIIMEADGKWKWDDSNQSDRPNALTDIDSGVGVIPLLASSPSTNQDWLVVERVEIKDASGNWVKLEQRDQTVEPTSINEKYKTDGTPTSYDLEGTTIILQPAPNYGSTSGMNVWFKRAPLLFSATGADTKRPGFASTFHEYLVLAPTYWWEKYKRVGDSEQTMRDMKEMEQSMRRHYSRRDKSQRKKLTRRYKNYE